MTPHERGRVLKERLDARVSEARIHHAWRGVENRLGHPRARPMRGVAIGGALLAAAAALVLFMSSRTLHSCGPICGGPNKFPAAARGLVAIAVAARVRPEAWRKRRREK